MTQNNKRLIVSVAIIATCVVLLLIFTLLGVMFIPSIQDLLEKYGSAKKAESELNAAQDTYYSTTQKLESEEAEYNKQKNKYDSISDETIDIIKEATTEESYNIEYMWITMGAYAKKNNLEIILVEPGGTQVSSNEDSNSQNKDSGNSGTTNATTTTTTNNSTTNTTTNATATSNNNSTTTNNANTANDQTVENGTSSSDSVLKVQITGSYMNTSDFIFEVENDTSLRFKLDNISMEYVEGTTIKTTFDVKNVVVNK